MSEQLLTVPQVADRLAISRWTVYRLINASQLRSIQVAGCRRIRISDLDAYIERISKAA